MCRFMLKYNRLLVSNHTGEKILIDTKFKKNTFRYNGKTVSYSATDGENPSTATFTKIGRRWKELILGFDELTWGDFIAELDCIEGKLSYLIIGTTMAVVFKETGGDTIQCRFTISYVK